MAVGYVWGGTNIHDGSVYKVREWNPSGLRRSWEVYRSPTGASMRVNDMPEGEATARLVVLVMGTSLTDLVSKVAALQALQQTATTLVVTEDSSTLTYSTRAGQPADEPRGPRFYHGTPPAVELAFDVPWHQVA